MVGRFQGAADQRVSERPLTSGTTSRVRTSPFALLKVTIVIYCTHFSRRSTTDGAVVESERPPQSTPR